MPLSFSSVWGWVNSSCVPGDSTKKKELSKGCVVAGQEVRVGHHQCCPGLLLLPILLAWIEPKPVDPRWTTMEHLVRQALPCVEQLLSCLLKMGDELCPGVTHLSCGCASPVPRR